MDIQLIIDSGKVVQYMTKYVTKSEPNSTKSIIRIMKKLLKSTSDDGLPANTVLKRTMGKLIGERMISQQETSHLILSIPLVTCSKRFVNLFLENDSKPIDLSLLWSSDTQKRNHGVRSRQSIKMSLLEAYAHRFDYRYWMDQDLQLKVEQTLKEMPLCTFVKRYSV